MFKDSHSSHWAALHLVFASLMMSMGLDCLALDFTHWGGHGAACYATPYTDRQCPFSQLCYLYPVVVKCKCTCTYL